MNWLLVCLFITSSQSLLEVSAFAQGNVDQLVYRNGDKVTRMAEFIHLDSPMEIDKTSYDVIRFNADFSGPYNPTVNFGSLVDGVWKSSKVSRHYFIRDSRFYITLKNITSGGPTAVLDDGKISFPDGSIRTWRALSKPDPKIYIEKVDLGSLARAQVHVLEKPFEYGGEAWTTIRFTRGYLTDYSVYFGNYVQTKMGLQLTERKYKLDGSHSKYGDLNLVNLPDGKYIKCGRGEVILADGSTVKSAAYQAYTIPSEKIHLLTTCGETMQKE